MSSTSTNSFSGAGHSDSDPLDGVESDVKVTYLYWKRQIEQLDKMVTKTSEWLVQGNNFRGYEGGVRLT